MITKVEAHKIETPLPQNLTKNHKGNRRWKRPLSSLLHLPCRLQQVKRESINFHDSDNVFIGCNQWSCKKIKIKNPIAWGQWAKSFLFTIFSSSNNLEYMGTYHTFSSGHILRANLDSLDLFRESTLGWHFHVFLLLDLKKPLFIQRSSSSGWRKWDEVPCLMMRF